MYSGYVIEAVIVALNELEKDFSLHYTLWTKSLLVCSVFVLSKSTSNNLHKQDINMLWNYFMIFSTDSLGYEIDSVTGALGLWTERKGERERVCLRGRDFSAGRQLLTGAVWCLCPRQMLNIKRDLAQGWTPCGVAFPALPRPPLRHTDINTLTQRNINTDPQTNWDTDHNRLRDVLKGTKLSVQNELRLTNNFERTLTKMGFRLSAPVM